MSRPADRIFDAFNALSSFLQQTHADQGGEATFDDWLGATLNDPLDDYHPEALVLDRASRGMYQ